MVERGDIKGIKGQIAELERLGDPYQPFVSQLRHLAKSYQLRKLHQLLKPYISGE